MFKLALWQGETVEYARTLAVNTLVAMEVFYLFTVRFLSQPSLTWSGIRGTRPVLLALLLVIVFQGVFTYMPFMQGIFNSAPLRWDSLLMAICAGVLVFCAVEATKNRSTSVKN